MNGVGLGADGMGQDALPHIGRYQLLKKLATRASPARRLEPRGRRPRRGAGGCGRDRRGGDGHRPAAADDDGGGATGRDGAARARAAAAREDVAPEDAAREDAAPEDAARAVRVLAGAGGHRDAGVPRAAVRHQLRRRQAGRIVNRELGREEKRTVDVPETGLVVKHRFGE